MKITLRLKNPFQVRGYLDWFTLGAAICLTDYVVYENLQVKPGEEPIDREPEPEAVFLKCKLQLFLGLVYLHLVIIIPIGKDLKLSDEEKGRAALEEFARKAFDAPFLPRTGNTSLHPPIPPEDPTHPQYVPKLK